MYFFAIPQGVLKRLDHFRSSFFWQGDNHKKKYRLTKWNIVCQPKDQGGLGITNLAVKNICLPSKWLYRLLNEDGVWQQIFQNKYLGGKSLIQVQGKPGDSHFWYGLMKFKNEFFKWRSF
jgi:hypothetical protein